jgi:hypothetical protein
MGACVSSVVNSAPTHDALDGTGTSLVRPAVWCSLPHGMSEQESLEAVLDEFVAAFETVPIVDGEREGALLVVSDDAGSATAVKFWRDALSTGLAVASPAAFPWCLANAPCASIAQRFGVTGPNLTWLASFADPRTAFDAPAAWLADRLCLEPGVGKRFDAWLLALHFGAPNARAMLWHWGRRGADGNEDDPLVLAAAIRDIVAAQWSAQPIGGV